MADPSRVREAVAWYSKRRFVYEALAKKVESIIRELLESENVSYHSVTCRAKSIPRYEEKAAKEKYKDPVSEIYDMAGVRVITYTDSEVNRAHEIVEKSFELIQEHSMDKSEELGADRVGYRSIHCVGTLGKDRLKLPENQIFKDMAFEIQIRTILQHAWAEFEHDRNYAFSGVLPKGMRRRLSIAAGTLESVDREFDSLAKEIELYKQEVTMKTEIGDLSIPINSTSLKVYTSARFKPLIERGFGDYSSLDKTIIDELLDMRVDTLEKLESIIPKNYIPTRMKYEISKPPTFAYVIRDILMIHDIDGYFKKAWKEHWNWTDKSQLAFFRKFGIDFRRYVKEFHLIVSKWPPPTELMEARWSKVD
jgi:putative GTP pyrophosphokinase